MALPDEPSHWSEGLAELDARGLRRRLRGIESACSARVRRDGREMICLCSNNYLGLANHPEVIEAARRAVEQWGWGAGASRLVSGHMTPHGELERRLAAFKGTEAALVCSTGYQANLAAIRGLAGKGDVILLDKLNHASIIDAARGSGATVRVFPHRDDGKLERLLERTADARRRVIVTDSLFSMDGDFADLPRLVELKRRHDAILCIDEAHATGVFGENGRGLAEAMGVEDEIDVVVGTLSKALGGIGGFVAGSAAFIDWLVNTAGAFIYTTALPPAACAAATAALDLIEREPERRHRLLAMAARLREELSGRHDLRPLTLAGPKDPARSDTATPRSDSAAARSERVGRQGSPATVQRGFDIAGSRSQIIPLVIGPADEAVKLAAALEAEGLLIPAIRPPTVPRGRSRLRISLCADHTDADLDLLLAALDRHRPRPR